MNHAPSASHSVFTKPSFNSKERKKEIKNPLKELLLAMPAYRDGSKVLIFHNFISLNEYSGFITEMYSDYDSCCGFSLRRSVVNGL